MCVDLMRFAAIKRGANIMSFEFIIFILLRRHHCGTLLIGFVVQFSFSNNQQVKILKVLVGNILVDSSANKAGGIGALCFLEEVDRVCGRDHLFKRSVLLAKAWWCGFGCMYTLFDVRLLRRLVTRSTNSDSRHGAMHAPLSHAPLSVSFRVILVLQFEQHVRESHPRFAPRPAVLVCSRNHGALHRQCVSRVGDLAAPSALCAALFSRWQFSDAHAALPGFGRTVE